MANDVIQYKGGGIRQNPVGKGTYKYMPTVALKRLSMRYQYGMLKYGATDNFKKGLPTDDCWDSAMRHMVAYMDGDNSEDHLAAAVWNLFTIMEMESSFSKKKKWQTIPSRICFSTGDCSPEHYWELAKRMYDGGEMK